VVFGNCTCVVGGIGGDGSGDTTGELFLARPVEQALCENIVAFHAPTEITSALAFALDGLATCLFLGPNVRRSTSTPTAKFSHISIPAYISTFTRYTTNIWLSSSSPTTIIYSIRFQVMLSLYCHISVGKKTVNNSRFCASCKFYSEC